MMAAPFVIGVVALYNWVICPHLGYLHAMRRLEPVMGRMADELNAVSESLDQKVATRWGVRKKLQAVRAGLFTREEAGSFIHDLQVLVENAGCSMIATDSTCDGPRETDDPNVPVLVEVSHTNLTVSGQYEQIVALLQTLREKRQKIWVDSCQMDLLDPRAGRLKCRFGLTLYALLEPGELGP